ncbi:MAG: CNNM domain-containing protein [Anaerolineae bacterium]|nr:CNNM domain-containing protein [Anaerolineae bacterium]
MLSVVLFAPVTPTTAEGGGSIGALLLYVLVALGFSFLCSLCEAILLSASVSHIEVMAQLGRQSGILMRKHKVNVERPISAILTLNTIAHTAGATGAGAEAAAIFGNDLITLISIVLTLLILVFSEIIPKTLGALYWKPLLPFAAWSIEILVILFYPFVWFFERMTSVMTPNEKEPTVTRSELEAMAEISSGEGALEETEHLILRNLLHLSRVQVGDIMTPRTVVLAFQQDTTVDEVINRHKVLPYSRIPIYDENTDDIIAFVLRNEILTAAAQDRPHVPLKELSRSLHSIPETMQVTKALEEFMSRQQHMFLVFDEYGGTAGIITMEDAFESLLGVEITDESDIVADMRELAQQRYQRQQQLLGVIVDEKNANPPAATP